MYLQFQVSPPNYVYHFLSYVACKVRQSQCYDWVVMAIFLLSGMGKEVENLILENTELLATK